MTLITNAIEFEVNSPENLHPIDFEIDKIGGGGTVNTVLLNNPTKTIGDVYGIAAPYQETNSSALTKMSVDYVDFTNSTSVDLVDLEPNPSATATEDLTKLKLGDVVYSVNGIPECPGIADGTYTYKCVISGGVKSYQWVYEPASNVYASGTFWSVEKDNNKISVT